MKGPDYAYVVVASYCLYLYVYIDNLPTCLLSSFSKSEHEKGCQITCNRVACCCFSELRCIFISPAVGYFASHFCVFFIVRNPQRVGKLYLLKNYDCLHSSRLDLLYAVVHRRTNMSTLPQIPYIGYVLV